MDIAILFVLILLNGFFAMSEIALITARDNRLKRLADGGDRSAAVARRLGQEPTQFLSTVQIGITAIGILNGIVGEAALARPLAELLHGLGLEEQTSAVGATTIVVVTITYLTIVIGELVPKRIAQFNAEGIARIVARPTDLLSKLSRPFVILLSVSTDAILRLIGKKELSSSNLTEDDIQAVLVEGHRTGVIAEHEHKMVRNVFRLDDRQIASLMTPRREIVYLDLDEPFDQSIDELVASDHSRFPVCRGGMDAVLGVISTKRLLKQQLRGQPAEKVTEYMLPPVFVPETLTGMRLLAQFRQSGTQMVFVVDEYGEILGLITLQDLLEALTGRFKPRDPEDVWAVKRSDDTWLLDGLIPLDELKDRLRIRKVPEEEKGRYHTLSGMMMMLIDQVPQTGDTAEWEGWRLEVVDLDENRVDKVLASRIAATDDPSARGK